MNKTLHKYILNTLGILIFAAIAVVTIIIARGNRIDFSNGTIIETGTIRIFSQPEDIQVYINEQSTTLSERRVEGIEPGEYQIRIAHEGYTSWEGEVEIAAGFITDISVRLFPIQQELTQFTQTSIDEIVFDRSRSNAIYSVLENPKGSELGIWKKTLSTPFLPFGGDDSTQRVTNITDEINFVNSDEEYHLITSPNSEKLIIASSDYSESYILDTNRYNEASESNQIKIDYPINDLKFVNNQSILIQSENLLIDYNIDTEESTLLFFDPVAEPIFDIEENTIYWLDVDRETIFKRTNSSTQELELENIIIPENINQIDVVSSGKYILLAQEESISFIETETSYFKNFNNQRYISASPNGETIIASASDGAINVIETKVSEFLENFTHTISTTTLSIDDINNGNLDWSFDSSFLIYKDINGEIVARDSELNNLTTLVTNEEDRIINDNFSLMTNSKALFVLLQDGTLENSQHNLYKIDFEE